MIIIYEYKNKSIKDKTSYNFILAISLFYCAFACFALVKNVFLGDKYGEYESRITFSPIDILKRMRAIQAIVILPLIYYLYKIIKDKSLKYCVEVALIAGTLFGAIVNSIIGSPSTDFVIWSGWIAVVILLTELWEQKPWMQVVLPTLIFGIFVNVLLKIYTNTGVKNIDMELIQVFQKAESEKQTEVTLSVDEFNRLGLHDPAARLAPHTIKSLGYVKNLLKIKKITTNEDSGIIVIDEFDPLSPNYWDKITITNELHENK